MDFNLAEMDLTEVARGGLELKLHEEQHKYIEAKSIEAKLNFNFSQVHLGQVEVQLGFASLDFNLASMDLIGVCGGSPRATPMKSNFGQVEVQLGFASLDFNLTEIGLQPK